MAEKIGAGNKPQNYNPSNGQYENGEGWTKEKADRVIQTLHKQNRQNLRRPLSNAEIEIVAKELSAKYKLPSMRRSGTQDDCLKEILDKKGFSVIPKRVAKKEFVEAIKNGKVVYRGVSTIEQEKQFYNGDCFVGQGFFGNGIYMSYDKNEALKYADNVIVSIVPESFNFAPNELKEEHKTFLQSWKSQNLDYEKLSEDEIERVENEYNFLKDFGKYCALKGYDGYISQKDKNIVVLNRGKLIIGENDEQKLFLEFN